MKIYRIPQDLRTIVFDIDGTLYTSPEYVAEQVDVQIRHWAKLNSITCDEARAKIASYRQEWSRTHGGKNISLGNAFTAFGISIEESIKWRNTLLHPEQYLKKNPELKNVLESLAQKYSLICVTNNPVEAARHTLEAVGIDTVLPQIIGLDTCMCSKPGRQVLDEVLVRTGSSFPQCLSVGDRYDIDLALPLELGMGAVEVTGAEDVCTLGKKLLHIKNPASKKSIRGFFR